MQVKESVVVITGASSGIGRATALAFAKAGATVVLAARGDEALRRVAEECEQLHGEALVVPTDVSDAAAVEELGTRAVERFGRIDVWVNNAAVTVFGSFLQTPLSDFRRVIDVDVMGYVHGARAALPYMLAQGRGVLVNVASILSVVPQPYASPYVTAKFAVRGLSASLRQELHLARTRGVHVCAVLPATVDTPIFSHGANYSGRRVLAMPPVYQPGRVARAIVNLVRVPRREVTVGPASRALAWQSRFTPRTVERAVAWLVDTKHLSRTESAPATAGNLYSPEPGTGSQLGGWRYDGHLASPGRVATTAALAVVAVAAARRVRH